MNWIKQGRYVTVIIALAILCFSSTILATTPEQAKVEKYLNYVLHVNIGLPKDNPYWSKPEQIKTVEDIKNIIADFYGIDKKYLNMFVRVSGAAELSPGNYFAVVSAGAPDEGGGKRLSACPVKDEQPQQRWVEAKWINGETCAADFLAIVDLAHHTVKRLYNPEGPNSVGKDIYQYGCYQAFPVSTADLNLNGQPDVFFVGGYGYGDEANRWSILTVFSSTDFQRLFSTRLNFEAWSVEDQGDKTYQNVVTGLYGKQPLKSPHPAHREFEKLFFKDFNKNGKLDILIWRRAYESRKASDPIKGYEFTGNTYEWYEQAGDGKPFVRQSISDELAEKWIKDHELNWKDGFPNENLCQRISHAKGQPFISGVEELHDQMLEQQ